jgi:DNA-binding HxlR family transcriptional regulator
MTAHDVPEQSILSDWYSARALVAAEWIPAILVALLDGPMTYSHLRATVEASRVAEGWNPRHERLHQSTLTRSLRQLTGDGLLVRDEVPGSFPRSVRYSLTAAARELLEAIGPLRVWAEQHRELVERARRRRWVPDGEVADDDPDEIVSSA